MVALLSKSTRLLHAFLVLLLFCSEYGFIQQASALGINYGQVANNLPPPKQVLQLLSVLNVTKTRIYDTNPQVLTTFSNSNVEIIVTIPNQLVLQLTDPAQAAQWVDLNIRPYVPSTKITGIQVGNEVYTTNDQTLMSSLVPAMVAIHQALARLGLDSLIHVSTANSLAVLQNSYPSSLGSIKPELIGFMGPFLRFLAQTGGPFWINAYPYFAYKDNPNQIPLQYVLGSGNVGMVDPYTKLRYDNMLYAQVDAVLFAMARAGWANVEVRVSETGWPSKGDENEYGATVQNARDYNRNILARLLRGEGTPLRPRQRLEVYLFALFNEDEKPGPLSERNYGLFKPDRTEVYDVGLTEGKLTGRLPDMGGGTSSPEVSSITSAATLGHMREAWSLWYWILIAFSLYMQLLSEI